MLLAAALAGAAACSSAPKAPELTSGTPPMAEPETRDFRTCQTDSDCVYVQNGCCDCANGGGAIAVHRDKVQAFRAKFDCSAASCTAMMNLPGCDKGTASCKAGLCEYAPAK